MKAIHPAKYTASIIAAAGTLLAEHLPNGGRILDPFAGVGTIHELATERLETVGVEIEPEWAEVHPDTVVGNALHLPFGDDSLDGIFTSPCYGNRFADKHRARDGSRRRSYTHDLRRMTGDDDRDLHPDNSGTLHWGSEYRAFHGKAWVEARRVLRPGAVFLLNVSDHVRGGVVQPVTDWHHECLRALGFTVVDVVRIGTPRMRYGANGKARVDHETVAVLINERKAS